MSQLDDRSPRPDPPAGDDKPPPPSAPAASGKRPPVTASTRPTGKPTGLPAPVAPPPPDAADRADVADPSDTAETRGVLVAPVPRGRGRVDVVGDPRVDALDPLDPLDPLDEDDLDLDLDDGFYEDDDYYWEDEEVADGDVAALVRSRRRKRKEWRQTERARRYAARRSVRFPIFTRAVLLWMLLFALVGSAFGGSSAFFWAHFNTQISELREQTKDFDKRSEEARGEIDAMRNQAVSDINRQLRPIAPFLVESNTVKIATAFAPYVWLVATLDEEGNASTGTAFAVAADGPNTLMVTSLNTVSAASLTPAPPIELRKGNDSLKATLVAFDADRDLALLSVPRSGLQILEWAPDEQQAQALGLRMFAVSGLGASGASLTSGIISDQNSAGFMHDARIGNATQGGPMVTADAKVLGVASLVYRPFGFDNGEIHFSISINQVCITLMECGGGARRAKVTGNKPPAKKPENKPAPQTPATTAAPPPADPPPDKANP